MGNYLSRERLVQLFHCVVVRSYLFKASLNKCVVVRSYLFKASLNSLRLSSVFFRFVFTKITMSKSANDMTESVNEQNISIYWY